MYTMMVKQKTDRELAKIIWDYLVMDMPLAKADVIIALGSIDDRVAVYAAELWHQKWAPILLCSGTGFGHQGDLLATDFSGKAESEHFAEIAIGRGVPEGSVLVENKSQNTGQNAQFSYAFLKERGIAANHIVAVTKPYMVRRAYATFKKQWPDPAAEIMVTAPPLPFDEYFDDAQPFEKVVNIMIGDLERIKKYPALGFQIEQDIPEEVWTAFEELVSRGYNQHLMK